MPEVEVQMPLIVMPSFCRIGLEGSNGHVGNCDVASVKENQHRVRIGRAWWVDPDRLVLAHYQIGKGLNDGHIHPLALEGPVKVLGKKLPDEIRLIGSGS